MIECCKDLIGKPRGKSVTVMLLRNLVRRGAALALMHEEEKAHPDFEQALRIDPSNRSLESDVRMLGDILKTRASGGSHLSSLSACRTCMCLHVV